MHRQRVVPNKGTSINIHLKTLIAKVTVRGAEFFSTDKIVDMGHLLWPIKLQQTN
jgi:hypothetical protein